MLGVFGLAADEVVIAQVVPLDFAGEDVPGGDEDRSGRSAIVAFWWPRRPRSRGIGREVGAFAAAGGFGGFGKAGAQPFGAFAGLAGALAGGLVLSGTDPGPGREVAVGGENVMSAPISAISSSAVRSTPGIVSSSATFCAKGAITSSILGQREIASSR